MTIAPFRALRHRDFRLFVFGQIFSLVGIWAQRMAQAWLVYELTNSAAWLGIIEACNALPMFFFSLIGGSLADRLPKRAILIGIYSTALVLALIYAGLIWSNKITILFIAILALMNGFLLAFEIPTRQSFYIELVGRDDLTNAIALNSATFNMARLLGPAIGGFLVARYGVAWCMFINSLSYTTIIFSLFFIKKQNSKFATKGSVSLRKSLKQIWYYLRGNRAIKGVFILISSTTVFGWSFLVILPVYTKVVLSGDAVVLGNLMSAAGLGALLAALIVATVSDRILPRKLAFIGLYTFIIAIFALAINHTLLVSLFSVGIAGFGLVMFYINANSALQRSAPHELRGRIMGVYALAFGGLMPVGSLQVGLVAEHFGVQTTMFISAIALTAISVFLARWLPPSIGPHGQLFL